MAARQIIFKKWICMLLSCQDIFCVENCPRTLKVDMLKHKRKKKKAVRVLYFDLVLQYQTKVSNTPL